MTALQDQQEVMADLADIITQVFTRSSRRCCARGSWLLPGKASRQ